MNSAQGLFDMTDTDTRERELDYREGDGLQVALVWYSDRDAIAVKVLDTRTGERFEIPVDPASARDAFEHPFAYAVEDELFALPLAA
jgi:hypothetical protein